MSTNAGGPIRLIKTIPTYEIRGDFIYRRNAGRLDVIPIEILRATNAAASEIIAEYDARGRKPIPIDRARRA